MIAYRIEMTATGHIYGRATHRDPQTFTRVLSVSGMFGHDMPTHECAGMHATHLWCEFRNVPTMGTW